MGSTPAAAIETMQRSTPNSFVIAYSEHNDEEPRLNLNNCKHNIFTPAEELSDVMCMHLTLKLAEEKAGRLPDLESMGFPMCIVGNEELLSDHLRLVAQTYEEDVQFDIKKTQTGWTANCAKNGQAQLRDQHHADRSMCVIRAALNASFSGNIPIPLTLWVYEQARAGKLELRF